MLYISPVPVRSQFSFMLNSRQIELIAASLILLFPISYTAMVFCINPYRFANDCCAKPAPFRFLIRSFNIRYFSWRFPFFLLGHGSDLYRKYKVRKKIKIARNSAERLKNIRKKAKISNLGRRKRKVPQMSKQQVQAIEHKF